LQRFYITHGLGMLDSFVGIHDLKFIFPARALAQLKPQMVGKKSALYAACSLCVLPTVVRLRRTKLDSAETFRLFVQSNQALIGAGRLIPFPMMDLAPSYGHAATRWQGTVELGAIDRKLNDNRIESYAAKSDAVPIFGEERALLTQLNEDLPDSAFRRVAGQRLFLPTLEGIEPEALLRVLDDHGDPTHDFRYALRGLLKDLTSLDSESRIFQLLERVDYEVRHLQTTIERIRTDTAWGSAEAALGVLSAGLSVVAPEWLTKSAAAAFGSMTALAGMRSLSHIRSRKRVVEDSDFYLPWLVHDKARDR